MNCCYDISSVLISIIILIYFGRSRRLKIYQNNVFFAIVSLNILTSLIDIINAYFLSIDSVHLTALYLCSLGYFITHLMIVPLFFIYSISIIKEWGELKKIYKCFAVIPGVIMALLILTNPLTDWVFYYEDGVYYRGVGMIPMYSIVAYYLLINFVILIKKRFLYTVRKQLAIHTSMIILILSVVIQYYHYELRVESFAVTFSSFFILCTINNPLDMVDKETGLFNRHAFETIFKKNLINGKYVDIVTVVLKEDDSSDILTDEGINLQYAEFFRSLWSQVSVFRIDEKEYVLQFEEADEDILRIIIKSIEDRFTGNWETGMTKVKMNARICLLSVPEDIDNLDKYKAVIKDMVETKKYYRYMKIDNFDVSKLERKKKINESLMKAVKRDSFEITYTPIFSLDKKKVSAVEAGTRFLDSELGFVEESDILEFAEKTGEVFSLAEHFFAKACDFILSEEAANNGIEALFIKLNSMMCIKNGIMEKYAKYAEEHSVPASKIVFLISEYALSKAAEILEDSMMKLHEKGYRFCLDEYGSGYTNMESIYALPFDNVKMSKSVTRDASVNEKAAISMEGVLNTFRDLNIGNIVDGINEVDEYKQLDLMSCEYAMGQLFTEKLDLNRLKEAIKELNSYEGGLGNGN